MNSEFNFALCKLKIWIRYSDVAAFFQSVNSICFSSQFYYSFPGSWGFKPHTERHSEYIEHTASVSPTFDPLWVVQSLQKRFSFSWKSNHSDRVNVNTRSNVNVIFLSNCDLSRRAFFFSAINEFFVQEICFLDVKFNMCFIECDQFI